MNENESQDHSEDQDNFLPVAIEVSEKLPSLNGAPDKAQQVLALIACGWSYESIGRLIGCTKQNIKYYVDHYDPDRKFQMSPDSRRKFLTKLWEARAGEALLRITPDKLERSSAKDLAAISATAVKAMRELGAKAEDPRRDLRDLLSQFIDVAEEDDEDHPRVPLGESLSLGSG